MTRLTLTEDQYKTIIANCLKVNSLDDTTLEIHGLVSEILDILDPIED